LSDYIINDEGCSLIADFLRENVQFTTINIRGNNITPLGFARICEALKNNLRVSTLLCEWNHIGLKSEGVMALKNLVESNPAIRTLDLKNNGIKPESAVILA